jgi:ABC-type multidrug transport system ATPase subunit
LHRFLPLSTGLIAVIGAEGRGKTSLLRRLSGDLLSLPGQEPLPEAVWLNLSLPDKDDQTPTQVWSALRQRYPAWSDDLQQDLMQALKLTPHVGKSLYMLSTGSRRKVALVGLLASGAKVTCLDQPYAALDGASIKVIREFLFDMSDHPSRSWVVADYEADSQLQWAHVISLDGEQHGR